ncbi:MAG: HAD family hydrolase [Patescibacteria group bacterium]|nr:HAD family hydrolase [Patescibacteria group bacterium]
MHKAIFIDRDNTLIKDEGYFHDPEAIEFIDGAIEALRALRKNGFLIFIITNQSGIGRGIFTKEELGDVHKEIIKLLKKEGVEIDAIYYCPHHPSDNCDCRKPKPYLVNQAIKNYDVDIKNSFFIGNDLKDMQTGRNAGVKTVAVFLKERPIQDLVDFKAVNFREVVNWILSETR